MIVGEDLNIKNVNDSQKFQDVIDFDEFITDRFPTTIVDMTHFLIVSKLMDQFTYLSKQVYYSVKLFAYLHPSTKRNTEQVLTVPAFARLLKVGKAKKYEAINKGEIYQGDDILNLVKLIHNV